MLTRPPPPSRMPLMDLMCMTMMMDPSTPVMQLPLLAPSKRPIKIKADSGGHLLRVRAASSCFLAGLMAH